MAGFTCMHSPTGVDRDRWIAHDPDGASAGEFKSELEATKAIERWNTKNGAKVTVHWKTSGNDAPESDRGTYTVSIEGTSWKRAIRCGWHSMEAASRLASRLRDAIAKHGYEAVAEIAEALD